MARPLHARGNLPTQNGWRHAELRRPPGLLLSDAVVDRLAVEATGVRMLAPTGTVRFGQLEGAGLPPFVHSGLARTWRRSIVHGRRVRAGGDESHASQEYPSHMRS